MSTSRDPRLPLDELARIGTAYLTGVIAIDSQSDERSETIPSTPGQRQLSEYVAGFFRELGYVAEIDENANLLATIPATAGVAAPKLAFLVHIDTSRGTEAVDELQHVPAWDGGRIPFPENDRLEVSAARYPETRVYVGEDILFGPGRYPVGFDDKLGLSEMMTLARVLTDEPDLPHPEIVLICRPDEEIGRMAAVEGLAAQLEARGVRYGYTIDGLAPFEIQTENFEASRGRVRVTGKPLADHSGTALTLRIEGCKSHGATAKAEGYLNSTSIVARAMSTLRDRGDITPVRFHSNVASEVDADVTFCVETEAARTALLSRLEELTDPHAWRGARVTELSTEATGSWTDATARAIAFVERFITSAGPMPILSEESEDRQGYSNPYFIATDDDEAMIELRLRAFSPEELRDREAHVRREARASGLDVEIEHQYHNMGPSLAPHPELVRWATAAARSIGVEPKVRPIRGGTGVDPFLARGIPIANLGTGYFAPESEKELTSRQQIAQHSRWLVHLVQQVTASA